MLRYPGFGQNEPSVRLRHHQLLSSLTTSSSIIIDDVLSSVSGPASPVAFFYFDHRDQHTQDPLSVLSSILRQLLEGLSELPKLALEVYEKRTSNGHLPQHECERLLLHFVNELECLYLVIDALDECDTIHRKAFLRSLGLLMQTGKVRLLVTSRPHIQDLTDWLHQHSNLLNMKIEAQDEDLETYLQQELDRQGVSDIADSNFANRLVRKLITDAEGMYVKRLLPIPHSIAPHIRSISSVDLYIPR